MRPEASLSVDRGQVKIAGRDVFVGDEAGLEDEFLRLLGTDNRDLVVTPNADQIIDLATNPQYRAAFEQASLRLLDGMPLVILARLLGARSARRITGADLLPWVCERSRRRGWRVAITGGRDDVLAAARDKLRERFPAAVIDTVPFPLLSSPADQAAVAVVDHLKRLQPDFTFLCLGSPKQELWFMHWRDKLPAGIYIGAGAAVDFAAGTVKRAPTIVQKASLEWAWRLILEPRRLAHRYLVKGPKFFIFAFRSIRKVVSR